MGYFQICIFALWTGYLQGLPILKLNSTDQVASPIPDTPPTLHFPPGGPGKAAASTKVPACPGKASVTIKIPGGPEKGPVIFNVPGGPDKITLEDGGTVAFEEAQPKEEEEPIDGAGPSSAAAKSQNSGYFEWNVNGTILTPQAVFNETSVTLAEMFPFLPFFAVVCASYLITFSFVWMWAPLYVCLALFTFVLTVLGICIPFLFIGFLFLTPLLLVGLCACCCLCCQPIHVCTFSTGGAT